MLTSTTSTLDHHVALVNIVVLEKSVPKPETYHHANLRKTLLDAAVALIDEVGPRAFTLREVARRAGVSHNAPYRHFASKDELLVAVAAEGFDRLTGVMEKAMKPGKTPLERLQLCGVGYVDFGLRWPQHLLVMFDLPAAARNDCNMQVVGENAFRVLLDSIVAAQRSGDLAAGDPLPPAWTAWSLVHGIAKLAISGNLPLSRRATIEFTRRATQGMFDGIAVKSVR
jgi:AcrR family transcriptional regulator